MKRGRLLVSLANASDDEQPGKKPRYRDKFEIRAHSPDANLSVQVAALDSGPTAATHEAPENGTPAVSFCASSLPAQDTINSPNTTVPDDAPAFDIISSTAVSRNDLITAMDGVPNAAPGGAPSAALQIAFTTMQPVDPFNALDGASTSVAVDAPSASLNSAPSTMPHMVHVIASDGSSPIQSATLGASVTVKHVDFFTTSDGAFTVVPEDASSMTLEKLNAPVLPVDSDAAVNGISTAASNNAALNITYLDLINCGSVPAYSISNSPLFQSHKMLPPRSAPLPINLQPFELHQLKHVDQSVLTLDGTGNMTQEEKPASVLMDSPQREFTPISGIEQLADTPDECFSDSGSSWIPDSDEEDMLPLKYRKPIEVEETDKSSSDIESASAVEIIQEVHKARNNFEPKQLTRWKIKDPSKSKRSVHKKLKHECLPYESKSGKKMSAKLPKPAKCDQTCRHKCTELFNEETRVNICKEYWGMKVYKQQKDFLLNLIDLLPTKRVLKGLPPEKQRKSSRVYKLCCSNSQVTRVCKSFFMQTLCISAGPIESAIKGLGDLGTFSGKDQRGRHTPKNKTKPEKYEEVKNHISSFPTMESHYCRKSSKRRYLDSTLSISKMYSLYRDMIARENKEKLDKQSNKQNEENLPNQNNGGDSKAFENKEPVSKAMYTKIFGTEFNLSFFRPKKDQCSLCNKYQKSKNPDQTLKDEYDSHIKRKESANKAKEADKMRSNEDASFLSVTVDLQSILQIPMNDIGPLYYSRKLNLQNLTIYECKLPNQGFCILWTELNGKRGSVEIATAIDWWVRQLPKEIKEVSIFSDTCAGQNRNQYIATFFVHLVQSSHLDVIEEKYLESGHSCMEVDSMHSAIEHEKRFTPVYSMIDWKAIMMRARSKRNKSKADPYIVNELTYDKMLDVKALTQQFMKNRSVSREGNKVQWLKIKCLRFEKSNPGVIKYRYTHDGPYFNLDMTLTSKPSQLREVRTTRRMTKDTKSQNLESNLQQLSEQKISTGDLLKTFKIPKAYPTGPLPISQAKKNDLLNLCKKEIIPKELHGWYEALPSSSTVVDTVPEPDVEDSET